MLFFAAGYKQINDNNKQLTQLRMLKQSIKLLNSLYERLLVSLSDLVDESKMIYMVGVL